MKRFASLLALILVVMSAPAGAEKVAVDAAFLTRLASAVNAHDVAALSALAAPGVKADFSWADDGPNMLTKSMPWQVQLLNPPGDETTFIAFTKYHPCESDSDHLYPVISTPAGPRLNAERQEYDLGGYRVRAHKLTVRFDVPSRNVNIADWVTLDKSPNAPASPVLRINSIYNVDSVHRNGAPVRFKQAGGFLAIDAPAEPRSIYEMKYHGRVDSSGEDYIMPNQAGLTSYWYPHTGRMPASSEVTIDVPEGWTAIGQGESLGKAINGKRVSYHWKNSMPVCYLTIAAGKFKVTTRNIGGIDYSAYLIHNDTARANRAIEVASGAIAWFSKNLSKFPYTRYAVVESDSFPAALECYSFTLCGRNMIPML